MLRLDNEQTAALEALKKVDPNLSIDWDEDTGTPTLIRGSLSLPAPPVGTQSMVDAAQEAARGFLTQYKSLYKLQDPGKEFPRSRVVSDQFGSTVHLFQFHQEVEVMDGELSVALDSQNRVMQVLGRYRPDLSLSTTPAVPAEQAIQIALGNLDVADKNLEPITSRLLILSTASLPDVAAPQGALRFAQDHGTQAAKLEKKALLAWRIEMLSWVSFVDAHDGSVIFTYDNTQTARNRETYATTNCRLLPGNLWIKEDGPVPNMPVDDIAWSAHNHAGVVYDYYFSNFGLDSFDGRGSKMISTVHSGINNGFTCDQNNAAFIPTRNQVVYGDGDGARFGPFPHALDVVAHEFTHGVVYYAITWSDGSPRGLDYKDESGALNESYADFFGNLIENKNWLLGEDCYTPQTSGDALRDMADPARYEQPDHYSKYISSGTQSYRVHMNSGIMNKCAYLMSVGGTHYNITVEAMGKEAASKIWYRALKHHLQGSSTFKDARQAFLQSCQELFPGDVVKYAAVQNACAAVGVGEPAPPARIEVEPTSLDFGAVLLSQSSERTLTVRNTGTTTLNVSSMRSSEAAFSISGSTTFQLAPGTAKTLTLKFSPTSVGPQQADLIITSNDTTQPTLTVPLSGTGVGVPQIAVEPASLDFGTVALGHSAQRTLTVRNSGTADLAVSAISSSEVAFSIVGDTTFQVAPGTTRGVTVQFTPSAVGQKQASLTIASNDSAKPTVTVRLSGVGIGVPHIAVEPSSLDFGAVPLGRSGERTLTVRNIGTADLTISAIRSSAAVFSVIGDTKFSLAPNISRALTVKFSPTSAGQQQANLTITSNDSSQPTLTVPLSGSGVNVPRIVVEPSSIDFGMVVLDQSAQRTLTVRNSGTADLTVSGIVSSEAAFSVVGDTAFQLAPTSSKTLTLKFSPTTAGQQQAKLTITSNDADQPSLNVNLLGTGIRGPAIVAKPEALDFGSVVIGDSAQLSLTISNAGGSQLLVSSLRVDQPTFRLLGNTNFSLDPGASKALFLQFVPIAEGYAQGTLFITSNDPKWPTLSVPLTGNGAPPPPGQPYLVLDVRELQFGSVPIGQAVRRNVTVKNRGAGVLTVDRMSTDISVYTVIGEMAFAVVPGASHTVVVEYKPTTQSTHHGTLTIWSNDPLHLQTTVALWGSSTTCFVSTAAYGSPMQRHVRTLRSFRDDSLLHSALGRALVDWYYRWSSHATVFIANSQGRRTLARWILLPLIVWARLMASLSARRRKPSN